MFAANAYSDNQSFLVAATQCTRSQNTHTRGMIIESFYVS